ncbi:alpha/beta hydrolase [Marivibrio halodurans]|uniref:Alpha/beta hydrolase n=1 Tax=Marivibrio halodurans TaxID=2039722 RepID=A0A8J7S861_9PROT|nr:alpha/beta hydrolase [Marivibrio halodurans]MBP5857227.1 alpha/beta hydrolase [Marivibrio halodurans]
MIIDIDGRPVFANTGGRDIDPSAPVALFVHGAGGDHSVWGLQTRYIAHHGAGVLALDLPGHGRTPGPALTNIPALAEFLEAAIDRAGLVQPVLVGHSMGALSCLEAAGRLGDRLKGLALCGVAAEMPVHPALLKAAAEDTPAAARMIASWGHGGPAHIGGNPAHGISALMTGIRLIERTPGEVLHADLKACADYAGALAAAAKVACPTALILGKQDRMTPAKAARPLAQAIAGAQTVILPASGHMMMVEDPNGVRAALVDLLTRIGAGTRAA